MKTEFGAHQNAIFDLAWMPGSEQKVSHVGLKLTIVKGRKYVYSIHLKIKIVRYILIEVFLYLHFNSREDCNGVR